MGQCAEALVGQKCHVRRGTHGVHAASLEADGGQVEVWIGHGGAQSRSSRWVVVVGAAHANADALKHDPIQRHRIAGLLHYSSQARGVRTDT